MPRARTLALATTGVALLAAVAVVGALGLHHLLAEAAVPSPIHDATGPRGGAAAPSSSTATAVAREKTAAARAAQRRLAHEVAHDIRPGNTLYYGLSVPGAPDSMQPVDALSDQIGKAPNLVMYYQDFPSSFDTTAALHAHAQDMLPMVTWDPLDQDTLASTPDDPRYTDAALLSGRYDSYYRAEAESIKALGFPVALRFAHEMNGDWYPWGVQTPGSGNTPAQFVALWRHVHDIFTSVGADNVIWVWSPNVLFGAHPTPLAQLWPGSRYVDWVGLSGYLNGPVTSFDQQYDATLDQLVRFAPNTPWMITETGASGPDKLSEMASLFQGVSADHHFIGLIWFDYLVTGADWRLEETPQSLATFRQLVAGPLWGAGLAARPASPG